MDPNYGVKYSVKAYPRWSSVYYTIHLCKLGYSGAVTELTPAKNVLELSGDDQPIEAPVKGRGGVLRVISKTDRQLLDLYTANPLEWLIIIYYENTTSLPAFIGYLEPELYEEPFNRDFNYEVSIQFNDGLSVLSRLPFVDEEGKQYRGFASIFEVLNRTLGKIGKSYASIHVSGDYRVYDGTDGTGFADFVRITTYSENVTQKNNYLNRLVVNCDNFIDEDGIPLSCRQVLESILADHSYCLCTQENRFMIFEPFLFRTTKIPDWIVVYPFDPGSGQFIYDPLQIDHTASRNGQYFSLSDFTILDSSFSILSGFNKYILSKNRYIKLLITPDAFERDTPDRVFLITQYSFDPYFSQVTDPSGPGRSAYLYYWGYWIAVYSSFDDWQNSVLVCPNIPFVASTNFYKGQFDPQTANPYTVSFYGGLKERKIVDDVPIDWQDDNSDFINYLFINNPLRAYDGDNGASIGSIELYRQSFYELPAGTCSVAGTYLKQVEIPYLYNSSKVLLHFYFIIRPVLISPVTSLGGPSTVTFTNVDDPLLSSYYIYGLRIFAIDRSGNRIAYLKNSAVNVNGVNDLHPEINGVAINNLAYVWEEYLGTETFEQTICKVILASQNEANNPQQISNVDIPLHLYMTASPVKQIYSIEAQFTNYYYEVQNFDPELNSYRKACKALKQDIFYMAVRQIGMEIVTKDTLEPISYEDEELQFYLSETFRTESKTEEMICYTGDDTRINDVGGYVAAVASLGAPHTVNHNHLYPIYGFESGILGSFASVEHFRGNLILQQYSSSRISLHMRTVHRWPSLNATHPEDRMLPDWFAAFIYPTDSLWMTKKFAITSFSYTMDDGELDITLEEYK